MIVSFHDNESKKVWEGEFSRKLPHDIQQIARRKLRMLNNAHRVDDLRIPPQNRLEKLSRDREGQWSIRINDQWCHFSRAFTHLVFTPIHPGTAC